MVLLGGLQPKSACRTDDPPPAGLPAHLRTRRLRDAPAGLVAHGHRPARSGPSGRNVDRKAAGGADRSDPGAAGSGARRVRPRHRRALRHRAGPHRVGAGAGADARGHRAADGAAGRAGQAVERVPAQLHHHRAHRRRPRVPGAAPRGAGEGRAGLRRAGRDHRRHHRRGDQLRRLHRQAPGHRCAVHAGLQLPAQRRSGARGLRAPPRAFLPRRAGAAVRTGARGEPRHHRADRQLRRRDGAGPVHAVELPRVRRRRRRRRPPRSVRQPCRRVRLDRQLLPPQGRRARRLGAGRAGGRARHAAAGFRGVQPGHLDRGLHAGRPRPARLPAGRAGRARRHRHAGLAGRRRRPAVLAGLPELLRDHPLQQLQDVRDGGLPAVAGDRRARDPPA